MIILINKDDSINYIKLPIIHGSKYLSVPKPTKVVEDSQMIVEFPTYSLYDIKRIDNKYIKHDWYITCAAWAFLDVEKKKIGKVEVIGVNDFESYDDNFREDYGVVAELHKILSDVDIVVGHNSDSFDLKKINYKFVKYGFTPVDIPFTVDTLKSAKKYLRATSNSLAFLARELGVPMKIDLPKGIMHAADAGCEKSLEKLKAYNKGDIRSGASLYFKLLPFIKNHPNMNSIMGNKSHNPICKSCGSKSVQKHGHAITKAAKYQRYKCNTCASTFRGKNALETYNGR